MGKNIVRIYHSACINFTEEQRFAEAIIKKYGRSHGNVKKAMYEALMQWIERVEREK